MLKRLERQKNLLFLLVPGRGSRLPEFLGDLSVQLVQIRSFVATADVRKALS